VNRWKNYYSHLLNVQAHRVSEVRQIEIHTGEPLVPNPSHFKVVIKFRQSWSGRRWDINSKIHKFINSICSKEEWPDEWKKSIIVPIYKKDDKNDNNYWGISLLSTSYKIVSNIFLSRLSPYVDEIIGDHQCGFRRNRPTNYQFFAFVRYWRKNGSTVRQYISYSYTSRKPMIQAAP
jgi:hypothetical protein